VILVAIVGWIVVLGVGRFVQIVWGAMVQVPLLSVGGDGLRDLYSSVEPRDASRHLAADKVAAIGTVFTAAFTVMLALVTRSMGRASRRQAAGDSPLLRVDVSVDPSPSHESNAGALAAGTPRYVHLTVHNVQSKPFAVARDIAITVQLASRELPSLSLARHRFEIEMLPPGKERRERIFDPEPFTEAQVSVASVEYYDLRGRHRRTAAYGGFTVELEPTGAVRSIDGYSEPKGWEMP
jgi:hypothetical protein